MSQSHRIRELLSIIAAAQVVKRRAEELILEELFTKPATATKKPLAKAKKKTGRK